MEHSPCFLPVFSATLSLRRFQLLGCSHVFEGNHIKRETQSYLPWKLSFLFQISRNKTQTHIYLIHWLCMERRRAHLFLEKLLPPIFSFSLFQSALSTPGKLEIGRKTHLFFKATLGLRFQRVIKLENQASKQGIL